ncbi:MaoC/PaaZ C-terminal domain-containing protein [Streptomyces sp. NPDC005373]|uniref:MaoC/PaaZ C-terminal domain-containing protein n=1 Tax=unclassified Streptomyces TaxID=2593676 RepID=UPI0033B2B2AB
MTGRTTYADVAVGSRLGEQSYPITRHTLIQYAGASGDFNTIHWSERTARAAGLPDVIGHGMLTMAETGRMLTDWAGGDPAALVEYGVRFTSPVVVPDTDAGTQVVVSAVVAEKLPDNRVAVELTATVNGTSVLAAARAVVQLV